MYVISCGLERVLQLCAFNLHFPSLLRDHLKWEILFISLKWLIIGWLYVCVGRGGRGCFDLKLFKAVIMKWWTNINLFSCGESAERKMYLSFLMTRLFSFSSSHFVKSDPICLLKVSSNWLWCLPTLADDSVSSVNFVLNKELCSG